MTQWTTKALPDKGETRSDDSSGERFVVLLLYGKNSFGDKIFSYLKITLENLQKLKTAIQSDNGFTPSDFGEVIAAGKGEPSEEIRNEVASLYAIVDAQASSGDTPKPIPAGKKAWDEY